MKSMCFLFSCFFLAALPIFTSGQSCCQISQENGRIAYDKGDFEAAFREWSEGLTSPDADQCPELAALVAKVQDKLSHSLVDQKKQEGPNEISDSAGVAAKTSPDPMSRPPGLSNQDIQFSPKFTGKIDDLTEGTIVLNVCVNREGLVISADYNPKGSNISDEELIDLAIKNARKWKFKPGEPEKQCGTITYRFKNQ